MKNKLSDLNNHLFAALERLSDEGMTPEQVEQEVKRAGAIVAVSDKVIGNANVMLSAAKLWAEHGQQVMPMLPKIGGNE